MMSGFARLRAAKKDGFILSSGGLGDDAAKQWFTLAKLHEFPFVLAFPHENGLSLVFMIDPKWHGSDEIMENAKALTSEIAHRHGSVVEEQNSADGGFVVNPLPSDAARELAHKLARLTGVEFPVAEAEEAS